MVHAVAPAIEYVAPRQGSQMDAPCSEKVLGGHGKHATPLDSLLPAAQGVHEELPCACVTVPLAHAMHTLSPASGV